MSQCQNGKLHKYMQIVKVLCINVCMHMHVCERLWWHVYAQQGCTQVRCMWVAAVPKC